MAVILHHKEHSRGVHNSPTGPGHLHLHVDVAMSPLEGRGPLRIYAQCGENKLGLLLLSHKMKLVVVEALPPETTSRSTFPVLNTRSAVGP